MKKDGDLARADTVSSDESVAETEPTARAATLPAPPPDPDSAAVELPAPYIFRRELSRGGMGRVLIAEDSRFGREVAIKLVRGARKELAARFERESLLTARLQHPGIVSVYDAGRLADGEPFFAMRLVSGRSLEEVLDGRDLPARLAVLPHLIAACDAVAFAHSRRVIHRDLKPHNILVGDFGETVVIDWGLAKERGERAEVAAGSDEKIDSGLTMAGQVMGTPAYMAPEQARGEEVDERADVYALGAVLHHLLAGEPPYEGPNSASVLAAVLAGPPESPSLREPRVPTDLIAVAQKAMARDKSARYSDAGALGDELRKYQTGGLVGAHRYSVAERVRRFTARQRAAVAVASVLLSALVIVTAVGVARITRERDEARAQRTEAQRARAAAEGLVQYLVAELAGRLERLGRVDLLKGIGEAIVSYEKSSPGGGAAPSARRARAFELIGAAEGPKGDLATAERALLTSIEERKKLGDSRALIAAERELARVRRIRNDLAGAAQFESRTGDLAQLAEAHSGDAAMLSDVASAWIEIGLLRAQREERERGLEALRHAVKAAERATVIAPGDPALRRVLAFARTELSDLLQRENKPDEALVEIKAAMQLFDGVVHDRPSEPSWQREMINVLRIAASEHAMAGHYEETMRVYQRAFAIATDLVRRDPDNLEWQETRLECLQQIAATQFDHGDYAESRRTHQVALTAVDELIARGINGEAFELLRAESLRILGWIDVEEGRPESSLPHIRRAADIYLRSYGALADNSPHQQLLAEVLGDLGYAELKAKRTNDAIDHLSHARTISDRWLARDPDGRYWRGQALIVDGWLGAALANAGRRTEAEAAFRAVLELSNKLLEKPASDDVELHAIVAEGCYQMIRALGRSPEAATLLQKELAQLAEFKKRGQLHASAAKAMPEWARALR